MQSLTNGHDEREYQRTHPFVSFRLDLTRIPADLWVLLGEIQSKVEHVAGVALPPKVQRDLARLYLAKGALATTAIEGNTLSEEQIRDLLNKKLELPPSKEYLATEVENIIKACQSIWDDKTDHFIDLTPVLIKEFNGMALAGLTLDENVVPGQIRQYSVTVSRYLAAPARDCEYLIERLCDWLGQADFQPTGHLSTVYAVIRAIVAHLYLAWIHPFGDGNGRTARLVEFQILSQAGVPEPSAQLLSNHYNMTRSEYYRQLDYASRSGGDIIPFLSYAARGFVDGLQEQLSRIRQFQLDIAWRDFLQEFFMSRKPTASLSRKHHLILALSRRDKDAPVPRSELRALDGQVAADYVRKGEKSVTRDIGFLVANSLIEKRNGGFRAKKGQMLAFLPMRKPASRRVAQSTKTK